MQSRITKLESIALLFPPYWDTDLPYLALPLLTAYLRKHGINVIQRDINIEWYNEILSSTYLGSMEEKLSSLMTQKCASKDQVICMATRRTMAPYAVEHIDNAKKNSRIVTNIATVEHSRQQIEFALSVISSIYYPTSIKYGKYISQYDCNHLLQVLQGAKSDKDNVFRNYFVNKIEELLSNNVMSLIGISLTVVSQLIPAFTLAYVVRILDPTIPIVIGGAMLPYMRQALLQVPECFDFADYFVIGEGESALLGLCNYLNNQGNLDNVPNLIYREEVTSRAKATYEYTENVNSLPAQDYEGLDLNLYPSPNSFTIQGSRGCCWDRCTFCSLCGSAVNKYRARDFELLVDNIEHLLTNYDGRQIEFVDACFTVARLERLVDLLEKRGLANRFKYIILSRFEKDLQFNLLQRAYATGLRWISWGLESAHIDTLRMMRKGISPEIAEQCLRYSHLCGIWNTVFTIVNFPGAPADDTKTTVEFTVRNQEYIDYLTTSKFGLKDGSNIHKHPEKYNITILPVPADYIGPRYSYYDKNNDQFHMHDGGLSIASATLVNAKINSTHMGFHWLDRLTVRHVLDQLDNGLQGKLAFRSLIQAEIENQSWIKKQLDRIESLTLQVPEYVKVSHISDMPSDTTHNVLIFNTKTGRYIVTNIGTLRIMQHARKGVDFKRLVDQLADKSSSVSRSRVEKEVRELCQVLILFGYLDIK